MSDKKCDCNCEYEYEKERRLEALINQLIVRLLDTQDDCEKYRIQAEQYEIQFKQTYKRLDSAKAEIKVLQEELDTIRGIKK